MAYHIVHINNNKHYTKNKEEFFYCFDQFPRLNLHSLCLLITIISHINEEKKKSETGSKESLPPFPNIDHYYLRRINYQSFPSILHDFPFLHFTLIHNSTSDRVSMPQKIRGKSILNLQTYGWGITLCYSCHQFSQRSFSLFLAWKESKDPSQFNAYGFNIFVN